MECLILSVILLNFYFGYRTNNGINLMCEWQSIPGGGSTASANTCVPGTGSSNHDQLVHTMVNNDIVIKTWCAVIREADDVQVTIYVQVQVHDLEIITLVYKCMILLLQKTKTNLYHIKMHLEKQILGLLVIAKEVSGVQRRVIVVKIMRCSIIADISMFLHCKWF